MLGTDPDWRSADLPADEEWRIEWVKFGWGLDLAHAGYQQVWEELTASWIRRCEPDEDSAEVTARRVLNWIYAWQRFDVRDDHADRLLASLADQVEHVRANLAPARNHRTLELYALLIAGLAFPELDLVELAVAELDRNLATDFRPDGVHVEASTHYHAIALRSFVGARENTRRYGIEFPPGFDERLERARAFLAHCTRPDGTIPALSDADTGDYRRLLGDAQRERNVSFPDGGYHVQRSGWDPEARYLIFDCGPLGDGGHGHYDLLSFEAHGGGRAAGRRPRPRQLLRGAAESAALVPRHRRAQHRLRRRARPDALQPRPAARAGGPRALPRPRDVAGARRADRRGDQPAVRGGAPAPDRVRRRRRVDRRGPPGERARAPLRPALPPRARGARAPPASRATPCARPASR